MLSTLERPRPGAAEPQSQPQQPAEDLDQSLSRLGAPRGGAVPQPFDAPACLAETKALVDCTKASYDFALDYLAHRATGRGFLMDEQSVQHQAAIADARVRTIEATYQSYAEHAGRRPGSFDHGVWRQIHGGILALAQEVADMALQMCGSLGYMQASYCGRFYVQLLRYAAGWPQAHSDAASASREAPWLSITDAQADERLVDWRQTAGAFLDTDVTAGYPAWEASHGLPKSLLAKFGERGYLSCLVGSSGEIPPDGLRKNLVLVEEIMRRGLVSVSLFTMLGANSVTPMLVKRASAHVRELMVPDLLKGVLLPCLATSECDRSMSYMVQSTQTTAHLEGSNWVLNGEKCYITNAPYADLALVLARIKGRGGPLSFGLFVIRMDEPGIRLLEEHAKLGMHSSRTGRLQLRDCRLPTERLVGQPGEGMVLLMEAIMAERLLIATGAVAFGIGLLNRLASALPAGMEAWRRHEATRLELVRAYCWHVAAQTSTHRVIAVDVAALKHYACDATRDMMSRLFTRLVEVGAPTPLLQEVADARVSMRAFSIFAGASGAMQELHGKRIAQSVRAGGKAREEPSCS